MNDFTIVGEEVKWMLFLLDVICKVRFVINYEPINADVQPMVVNRKEGKNET